MNNAVRLLDRGQLKNNRGVATIMAVAILSLMIVTSLATIHMYLNSRAQHHGRIKKAYQTTFVMEDLSKLVYNAIESYGNLGRTCPSGTTPAAVPGTEPALTGCWAPCPSNAGIPNTCTRDSAGKSICLGASDGTGNVCDQAAAITKADPLPSDSEEMWATTDSEELQKVLSQDIAAYSIIEDKVIPALISLSQASLFISEAHAIGTAPALETNRPVLVMAPVNCATTPDDSRCQKCNGSNCPQLTLICSSGAKTFACGVQTLQLDAALVAKVVTPSSTPHPANDTPTSDEAPVVAVDDVTADRQPTQGSGGIVDPVGGGSTDNQ